MAIFNSGVRGKRAKDGVGVISSQAQFVQQESPSLAITSFSIDGTDDLALNTAGGQTVVVHGSGFKSGLTGIVGNNTISAITVVDPTTVTFTAPALSAGSYTLTLANSNGSAAILVPGLVYSSVPVFSTAAGSIGTYYETKPISTGVSASSDSSITYTLVSGALPSGATLNSNGTITGTSPVDNASTTYNFSIKATDAELQDVTRSFTLTINTDVVTWVTPSNGATINLDGTAYSQALTATDAASYSVSYSANALPTGLSLSNGTISGTPTGDGSITTLLTATAATSGRSVTNTITWVVSITDVYFKYSTLLLSANSSTQASSFVSDNSINNSQLTVAGKARPSNFNPYQHGYYSVDLGASTYVRADNNDLFRFRTGDFTIEFWLYCNINWTALTNPGVAGQKLNDSSTGWQIYRNSSNDTDKMNIRISSTNDYHSNAIPSTGVWEHWAVTRQSGTLRWFKNGVLTNTHNNVTSDINDTGGYFFCGFTQTWSGYSNFKLSNMRIIKGTALYTSAFTPSATPLNNVVNTSVLLFNSNKIVDSSPNNLTLTTSGTPIVSAANPFTAVYQAGTQYYSTYFNGGSTDNLSVAGVGNFTGDFTIEAWINVSNASSGNVQAILGQYSGGNWFDFRWWTTSFQISQNTSAGTNLGGTITSNTWNHVALVRSSGIIYLYVNGVATGTTISNSSTLGYNVTTYIGNSGNSANPFVGCISNLRVINGTALYTANFTPSTTPLTAVSGTILLTCQDSTFKDNSTNNFTITPNSTLVKPVATAPFTSNYTSNQITTFGSGYFDGSSSYLSLPATPSTQLGTDFTVECWINITGTQTTTYGWGIIGTYDGGSNGGWSITVNRTTGSYGLGFVHGNAWQATYTGGYLATNTWYHIAVSRSGSNLRMFINGTQAGSTATYATADTVSATLYIGSQGLGQYHTGYISDVRIVKGTALYTSNFVPPINSQLTNVTNTKLLTLQSNNNTNNSNFKDSSKFNSVVTRNGNATQGTFSPYGDNWSVFFGGNNSFLTTSSSSILPATQNTFTIECWVYLTANASAYGSPFVPGTFGDINGVTNYLSFGPAYSSGASGNVLSFYWYDSAGKGCSGTGLISLNRWTHIAISVSANTIKMFIDGTLQTLTGTTTLTNRGGTSGGYQIGAYSYGNNSVTNGYISNVRVVSGTALYSSSFTPSTSPLTVVPNTTLLACQSPSVVSNALIATTWTKAGTTSVQKFSPFGTITVPKYFSAYFNGSANSLTFTGNTSTRVTGGDWTFEAWIYLSSSNSETYPPILKDTSASWGLPLLLAGSTNGNKVLNCQVGSSTSASGPSYVTVDAWHHVASVRSGTTITVYLDGVPGTPITNDITLSTTPTWVIGSDGSTRYFNGYISNLRIVKGQALYTGTFTPSTSPLTTTTVGATGAGAAASITGTVSLLTCQSNTFVDNSTNAFAITATTATVKPLPISPFAATASSLVSYSPSGFGGSMYFDGDSDYLTIPGSALFNLGSSTSTPWTVECWVYQLAAKTTNFVSQGAAVWRISIGTDAKVSWVFGGSSVQTATDAIQYNAWNHLAFSYDGTYSGTSNKLFINGILQAAQGQYIPPDDSSTTLYIGRNVDGGTAWDTNGYISDVRITKGVCLYKSSFFPPTEPLSQTANTTLLVSGTSSGIIDSTRTVDFETVGDIKLVNFSPYNGSYYSVSFPASGSRLGFTQPALGSAFTIEMWVYPTTAPSTDQYYYSGGSPTGPLIGYNGTTLSAAHQGSWSVASSVNPVVGSWSHIAVVREGTGTNQFKIYVNGTLTGTGTDATTFGVQSSSNIGNNNTSGGAVIGYISNIRITNNQALYTGSFTPSTSPLTTTAVGSTGAGAAASLTGTVLLLSCQSNKFVDNSASPLILTSSGSTVIQAQNPFQVNTGTSVYFDGTGDYLVTFNITPFAFKTGDLTMEAWIFRTDTGTQRTIIDTRGSADVGILFFITSDDKLNLFDSTSTYLSSTNTVPAYQWVHVAVSRSSNTTKLFIAGNLEATLGSDTRTYVTNSVGGVMVGRQYGSTTNDFMGYITDVRITNGNARYTSTFTPNTTSFKVK